MSHSGLLVNTNFRGSSSRMTLCKRRRYFYFKRARILAREHAEGLILNPSSSKDYLPKMRKNGFDFIKNLIGERLARTILSANKFRVRIDRKNVRHFNFYYGENKQGKMVALLELF